jgi:hypothetical protein
MRCETFSQPDRATFRLKLPMQVPPEVPPES